MITLLGRQCDGPLRVVPYGLRLTQLAAQDEREDVPEGVRVRGPHPVRQGERLQAPPAGLVGLAAEPEAPEAVDEGDQPRLLAEAERQVGLAVQVVEPAGLFEVRQGGRVLAREEAGDAARRMGDEGEVRVVGRRRELLQETLAQLPGRRPFAAQQVEGPEAVEDRKRSASSPSSSTSCRARA